MMSKVKLKRKKSNRIRGGKSGTIYDDRGHVIEDIKVKGAKGFKDPLGHYDRGASAHDDLAISKLRHDRRKFAESIAFHPRKKKNKIRKAR